MCNLTESNKLKIIFTRIFILLIMVLLLTFSVHILLNIGRYLGTIARYSVEGNICLP